MIDYIIQKMFEVYFNKEFRTWSKDSFFEIMRMYISDEYYIEIVKPIILKSDIQVILFKSILKYGDEMDRIILEEFFISKDNNSIDIENFDNMMRLIKDIRKEQ